MQILGKQACSRLPKCAEFKNTCYVISEFYLKLNTKSANKIIWHIILLYIWVYIHILRRPQQFAKIFQLIWRLICQLNSEQNLWGHRFSQNPNQKLQRFCPGSLLEGRAEISVFWLGFWEKRWPHKFILNLPDL